MSGTWRTILADILAGLGAFLVVRLMPHIVGSHQDIRPFLVTTFVAFMIAVCVRARSPWRWISVLRIVGSGMLPGVVLRLAGISLTDNIFFVTFLAATIAGGVVGATLQQLDRLTLLSRVGLGVLIVLLVFPLAYRLLPRFIDEHAYTFVHQRIPSFTLKTLDGRILTSENLRGHVVVIAFWATWCLPCQEELPKLDGVARRYARNGQVIMVAVDSGTAGDTPEKARDYARQKRLNIPIAVDATDDPLQESAAMSFNVPSLPALYIMDKEGDLRVIHLGYEASEDLERSISVQIERLL